MTSTRSRRKPRRKSHIQPWVPPNAYESAGLFGGIAEMMQIKPELHGKDLAKDGDWIIVIAPPRGTEYTVEHLSCWYAVPDPYVVTHADSKIPPHHHYRVRLLTPNGLLWLWPHEYVVLRGDLTRLFSHEGIEVHYISDRATVDPDRLFYLRQRGIPKQEALMMLIGEVREQTFCWFTMPEDCKDELSGVGVPLQIARNVPPRAAWTDVDISRILTT